MNFNMEKKVMVHVLRFCQAYTHEIQKSQIKYFESLTFFSCCSYMFKRIVGYI